MVTESSEMYSANTHQSVRTTFELTDCWNTLAIPDTSNRSVCGHDL